MRPTGLFLSIPTRWLIVRKKINALAIITSSETAALPTSRPSSAASVQRAADTCDAAKSVAKAACSSAVRRRCQPQPSPSAKNPAHSASTALGCRGPSTNVWRMDCRDCSSLANSRNAYLLNGLLDARRTKNRDCKTPGGSPRFWSDTVNLKGTASANSFARGLLLFS